MAQNTLTTSNTAYQNREFSTIQRLSWNFTDTLTMTKRNLIHYFRLPQLIVFSSIQPIMFTLLFAYVFGGAIATPNGSYIDYLLPGIIAQTVLFGTTQTAVGLAEDLSKGMVDRFRTLPMARAAVLAGRTLADSIRNIFVILLIIVVGYLIGFRFQNGLFNAIGAIALAVAFGHAVSWISALVGMITKDPETAQVAGFVWIFPFVFASSSFVPTQSMSNDLVRTFAENQPVTAAVDAIRVLILGGDMGEIWTALAWIVGLMIVFVPLAVSQYRRSV